MKEISRDYGKYPTFAPVKNVPSGSGGDESLDYGKYPAFAPVKCRSRQKLPAGVLRVDEFSGTFEQACMAPVFGSGYWREQIKSVTFVDTLADMGKDAWDVSEAGNGSVMAWVQPNGELYDLYIGGKGKIYAGESCNTMFAGYENAERITFGGALDTADDRDMGGMFMGCRSLTELDLSGFNTEKVQNMALMLEGCEALTTVNVSGFDTSGVTVMRGMFQECRSLKNLKLGRGFVTKQADTTDMYQNCPAGKKKTSRKKPAGVLRADEGPAFGSADKHPVFGSKYQRWQIGSVTFVDNLKDMPKDAWDVSETGDGSVKAWVKKNGWQYDLYIGGWGRVRTGKSCKGMFAGYTGVRRFHFGSALDTGAAEKMQGMFRDCRELQTLDLSSFRTGSVVNMREMFDSCTALTSLNLKGVDTSKVRDMGRMFRNCFKLNGLNISYFDTASVRSMDGMFSGCKSLNDISRPYEFVPDGAATKEMYKDCPADDRTMFSGLRKLFGR